MDNRRDFIKAGLAIGATTALSGVSSALPHAADPGALPASGLSASAGTLVQTGAKLIPRIAGYGDFTGPDTPNGLPMNVFQQGSQVFSQLTIPPQFAGWKDSVRSYAHDGAVATILTTVAGFQAMISSKQPARSTSVTLNFIAPVPIGPTLQAIANPPQMLSPTQMQVGAGIYDVNNVLLASATAVWQLFTEQQADVICNPSDVTAFENNMATFSKTA